MGIGAMGPEAAVLSARLVELRACSLGADREVPADAPMWVEVAVRAARTEDATDAVPDERAWGWVRTALRWIRTGPAAPPAPRGGVATLAALARDPE